jgi:hypothetical protein
MTYQREPIAPCSFLQRFCESVHEMDEAHLTAGGQLRKLERTMQRTIMKLCRLERMGGALAARQAESVRGCGLLQAASRAPAEN